MAEKAECRNCRFYRKDTNNYGECMLRPPVYTGALNAEHPDNWTRPKVWLDDFCDDFSAVKIVESKKPNSGKQPRKGPGTKPQQSLPL